MGTYGENLLIPSRRNCAFCEEKKLVVFMDFGEMALAGAFLIEADFSKEQRFHLRICFCTNCYAVQVEEDVPPEMLFDNYFYFSSAIRTLREHFAEYAKEVSSRFLPKPEKAAVLEIGCNDGVLLSPLADEGIGTIVGIDPAARITATIADARVNVINGYFGPETARNIKERFGTMDLVMANNAFAHVSDINGLTSAIADVLADDGIFIFEVHYLGSVLAELQYDMMYHEHLYYYSLLALENHLGRHGMVVFDLKPIPIHGGSMRFYAAKKHSRHVANITKAVADLRASELDRGYNKPETYHDFALQCADLRRELMTLLSKLRHEGKTIAGYGASGRANTVIQYCGITRGHLDYIIDDAPMKLGFYTPGSHFLIKSNEVLKTAPPDYVLIFAWAFLTEIGVKCKDYLQQGGHFIVPLPEVRLYPKEHY